MIPYYMDTCSNSRANTCHRKPQPLEGVYLLVSDQLWATSALVNHDNSTNRKVSSGDGSFKYLPYQLLMVG